MHIKESGSLWSSSDCISLVNSTYLPGQSLSWPLLAAIALGLLPLSNMRVRACWLWHSRPRLREFIHSVRAAFRSMERLPAPLQPSHRHVISVMCRNRPPAATQTSLRLLSLCCERNPYHSCKPRISQWTEHSIHPALGSLCVRTSTLAHTCTYMSSKNNCSIFCRVTLHLTYLYI